MGLRLIVSFAILAAVSAAPAHDRRPQVEGVVHAGSICWDPDVEFPVPCDDDDD